MWRKVLWTVCGLLALSTLVLAGMIVSIRSGLQRFSADAVARFPGERVEALMRVVDCGACPLEERNRAVWALGQVAEQRAGSVLRNHLDGRPCPHESRLCQNELQKAIRMIETRKERTGPLASVVAGWHQPWR
ncbi:MAG: hypothetical protein SFV51_06125 [Bryobacteraceae bacterium]|nr:hypothetical protein [Bryobacteraceae bacterium]